MIDRLFIQPWPYTFLIFCLWLGGCQSSTAPSSTQEMGNILPPPPQVDTHKVSEGILWQRLEAKAKVFAKQQTELSFEQNGKILFHTLKEGKYVKKGSLLAMLDQSELLIAEEEARLMEEEAKQKLKVLLIERGYDSTAPPPEKERFLQLESGYLKAQLNHRKAEYYLKRCSLKAPFSGILSNVKAAPYQTIQVGEPIALLTAMNSLWLRADILAEDLSRLNMGAEAEVKINSRENVFSANLLEINPNVNEEGLISINLKLENNIPWVYPGMYAQVFIPTGSSQAYPLIPRKALLRKEGETLVIVFEDGRAVWRFVSTGQKNQDQVEILEGLKGGEIVLTDGHLHLSHLARVQPR